MEKTKKQIVRKDTSLEDVLQWDKDGVTLTWDVDDFKELSHAQLKPLSKANRDRYGVFAEIAKEEGRGSSIDDDDIGYGVQVGPAAGSAQERLKVGKSRAGYRHRWERPDMVNVRKEQGWKVASNGYSTLRNADGQGLHRIGTKGQEELVLMEIPEETYSKLQGAKKARRKRAIEGVTNQAKSEIERLGGGRVDDSSKANFQPIDSQEVKNG